MSFFCVLSMVLYNTNHLMGMKPCILQHVMLIHTNNTASLEFNGRCRLCPLCFPVFLRNLVQFSSKPWYWLLLHITWNAVCFRHHRLLSRRSRFTSIISPLIRSPTCSSLEMSIEMFDSILAITLLSIGQQNQWFPGKLKEGQQRKSLCHYGGPRV